jgi:two-component system cell cycle response regulator
MKAPRPIRAILWILFAWLAAYEAGAVLAPGWQDTAVFSRWIHDGVLLAACGICIARVVRVREERLAWSLLAAALLSWTLGEIYYTGVLWNEDPIPIPSLADLGYLGFVPLAFSGLVVLLRGRVSARRTVWLDGLTAALAAAALSAAIVFQVVLGEVGGRPLSVATNLAYPVGDLLLLGVVVVGLALSGWRPGRTWLLLGGGIAAFLIADSLYLVETAKNTYAPGSVFDEGWWAGITLVAVASWLGPPPKRRVSGERLDKIVMPLAFALVGLAVLLWASRHQLNPLAIGLAAASLVAVMARLAQTFRDNVAILVASRHEALTDGLTELGNRRRLLRDLDAALSAIPPQDDLALLLFDLDGFKQYNDTFGHPAGDALLGRLGRALSVAVSPWGDAYRMGGDEFSAVVRLGAAKLDTVAAAAREALSEHGPGFSVTTSLGVVRLPFEAATSRDALLVADTRLYREKGARRTSPGRQTTDALLQILSERHPALGEHVNGVAKLAGDVGRALGFDNEALDELVRAAELHDIGKIAVPDTILHKPGPLTDEEWAFIRRHTLIGERILGAAPSLRPVGKLVRSSHERFDGAGYPDGLAGQDIPLGARIILACDAYDAMTSDRAYRARSTSDEALAELRRCAGTQFDPVVVEALVAIVERAAVLA